MQTGFCHLLSTCNYYKELFYIRFHHDHATSMCLTIGLNEIGNINKCMLVNEIDVFCLFACLFVCYSTVNGIIKCMILVIIFFQHLRTTSTYWDRVKHVCARKLGPHYFRQCLVAYSVPSHYLNRYWIPVNRTIWNKLQWEFHQN